MLTIRLGRYILYELCCPVQSCKTFADCNVRLVTSYDEISDNRLGIQKETMERLLQNNTDLFVYFKENDPVGMLWGHLGSCYIRGPGISIIQDADTVYSFWAYVIPEFRNQNILNSLYNVFFDRYKGKKKIRCLIEPVNKIMILKKRKQGFIELENIFYINFVKFSILVKKCTKSKKLTLNLECNNVYNLLSI